MTEAAPPVGRLVLGAMNFGARTREDEALRIIERALSRGITEVDTANSYNDGASERIVGRALRDLPSIKIATKVGLARVQGKPEGLRPERILNSVHESRERLGRPTIDLLYLHAPDSTVPLEETLGAIKTLLDTGVIRTFGISNFASWQILEILQTCKSLNMNIPAASQVLYNLAVRQLDIEYFAFARRYGLRTVVYNGLAGGLLSGSYPVDSPLPKSSRLGSNRIYQSRYGSLRMRQLAEGLGRIAAEHHISLVQLAYRWLLGRPGVDSVLLGPATLAQLDAALEGVSQPLGSDAKDAIDQFLSEYDGTNANYAR